jgi:hypothetical protein
VRQLLVWLGEADPAESNRQVRRRDGGEDLHERLLDWVGDRVNGSGGVSCTELLKSLQPRRGFASTAPAEPESEEARGELYAAICAELGGEPDVLRLSWVLRRRHDAVLNGRALRTRPSNAGGRNVLWYVERVAEVQEGNGVMADEAAPADAERAHST